MTGDPVREAVGVFRDGSPLRGAVYAPPMSGFDRSDIGVPAGRRSIEGGVDPSMSFFNKIGLSKSEALNRVRMNKGWL